METLTKRRIAGLMAMDQVEVSKQVDCSVLVDLIHAGRSSGWLMN